MLASQLGDGIGADGAGQHLLMLGQGGSIAIDGRRAGIDDAAHASSAGGDEKVDRRIDAVAVGCHGIGHGARDRRKCRFVEDDFDAGAGLSANCRIGQVALHEFHGF